MPAVTISKADLERRLEDKLRAFGTPTEPAKQTNLRPEADERNAPRGVAGRGSASFSARQSSITPEEAGLVMEFLRAANDKDGAGMRSAASKLGMSGQRLQQVGVSADGGYTVPEQFVSEVLIDLPKMTPFADPNIVRIVPMEGETLRWTKVVSRPSDPAYVAEGATYGKTGVTFGPITLVAKKIGEIIPFTDEVLMSNKIAMLQVVTQLVAESFAFKYNSLVTAGNGGATEPEGVLSNANVLTDAWDATDDRTRADSLIDLFHTLPSQYRGEAIWQMHDSTIKIVRKLKDLEGRYIWTDGFGATPAMILGRPVFENPDLPTTNILFGNFRRGYVIGKREGMTVDRNSSGSDWEKDIVNFKFRERWDGRVHDEKAFVISTGVA